MRALPENQVFTPPRPDDFQAPTQEEVYETLTDEEKADLWMQTQGITIRVSDDPYDPNAQRLKNQLELMYETGAIDDEDVQHLIDIGVLEQDAIDVDVTEQDTGTGTGRFYTYSNPYKYSFRYGSGGGGWGGYGSGGGGRGYASYASRQPNEFLSYPGFLPNVRWNF
ncbi:MAG: hypothetical protein MJA29_10785 [Candidatus Omnitrophica bacterium]|nr:hypothetical protein [Candidatus Omnitrophota bacterium]